MTPCIQSNGMSPPSMTPDIMRSTPMTPGHLQPSLSPTHIDSSRLTAAPLEQTSMTPSTSDISHTIVAGLPQIPGDQVNIIFINVKYLHDTRLLLFYFSNLKKASIIFSCKINLAHLLPPVICDIDLLLFICHCS